MDSNRVDVLIIGAGLAGLSTAYHLEREYLVLEKENTPGGAARSLTSGGGGSTYDFTGHLLHLRKPEMRNLVDELLAGKLMEVERRAGIFMLDRFIPYPFQANFHPLPQEIVRECLIGFIKARGRKKEELGNFKQWALATLGEGICKYFFFPYNQKLFLTDPEDMSADWVSWSVPQPDLETVVDGALGTTTEGLGYNATFLYPKEGGIEILANSLAERVDPVVCNERLIELDPVKRLAVTASGRGIHYNQVVSTMPLPALLEILVEHDEPKTSDWSSGLRWVNVFNLNFTLDKLPDWDWQWLYLPEPEFRCYRIGVSSNISFTLAPPGCSTVYTEVSYRPGERIDEEKLKKEIRDDLRRVGLLKSGVNILDETLIRIEPAYVIHDDFRMQHLELIHAWLRSHGIISTGRWGAWGYGGMEDALWQGYETARELNSME